MAVAGVKWHGHTPVMAMVVPSGDIGLEPGIAVGPAAYR